MTDFPQLLVSGIATGAIRADIARGHPPRHPAIHRTRSVDCVIVLEGEIDLLLDDRDVKLEAGELAMVFVDADEPPEIGT